MIEIIDGQEYEVFTTPRGTVIRSLKSPQEVPGVSKDPLTVLQFRKRFTQAEKVAIYEAAKTMTLVQVWLDDLATAQEVSRDDPETIAGVQGLEAVGLLSVGRANEILA
jgi:hypothetical protein